VLFVFRDASGPRPHINIPPDAPDIQAPEALSKTSPVLLAKRSPSERSRCRVLASVALSPLSTGC
jgi:hypothetical protein